MIRHQFRKSLKYKNIPTVVDGIKFPSQKEANYYRELKIRMKAENSDIIFFLRQVPFDLPGKIRYFLDFMIFKIDGTIDCVETKGKRTKDYIIKKKLVEALYPIKIREI